MGGFRGCLGSSSTPLLSFLSHTIPLHCRCGCSHVLIDLRWILCCGGKSAIMADLNTKEARINDYMVRPQGKLHLWLWKWVFIEACMLCIGGEHPLPQPPLLAPTSHLIHKQVSGSPSEFVLLRLSLKFLLAHCLPVCSPDCLLPCVSLAFLLV